MEGEVTGKGKSISVMVTMISRTLFPWGQECLLMSMLVWRTNNSLFANIALEITQYQDFRTI